MTENFIAAPCCLILKFLFEGVHRIRSASLQSKTKGMTPNPTN